MLHLREVHNILSQKKIKHNLKKCSNRVQPVHRILIIIRPMGEFKKTILSSSIAIKKYNNVIRRLIESDAKSLSSLQSNHSRKGSDASQISLASGCSNGANGTNNGSNNVNNNNNNDSATARRSTSAATDGEENIWTLWGNIVADWDNQWKKRKEFVKELVRQGIPHHFR